MTKGYSQIPHSIYECGLNNWELLLLGYLIDCENRFQKQGEWFNLTDNNIINVLGFGKDKRILREAKDNLVSKKYIKYKGGHQGKQSQYMVTFNPQETISEDKEEVEIPISQPKPTPKSREIQNKQEWFESFRGCIDPNRKFNSSWDKFYTDKKEAAADVENYLRQYSMFIKLV